MVKSADRVIEILELLSEAGAGMRLADVREHLDLPTSSAHGLMKTLEQKGYVQLSRENKRYRLTPKVLELGNRFIGNIDLSEIARPIMEHIREVLNETVNIGVLESTDVVYFAKVESNKTLRLAAYVQIGMKLPAHATALGKILLSDLDPAKIEKLYEGQELQRLTENTITSFKRLNQELKQVRENGYAYDDQESTEGLRCLAVPIRNHENRVVAAMSVSVPAFRLDEKYAKKIVPLISQGAKEISTGLGWKENLMAEAPST